MHIDLNGVMTAMYGQTEAAPRICCLSVSR